MITRIDHYEIIEEIGEGGMGVVYKARDSKLFGMEVALKTIKDHPDKGTVEQFGKEMRILTTLNHPNIVDILAIGEFEEGTAKKPGWFKFGPKWVTA